MRASPSTDFSEFEPLDYLTEYYSEIDAENRFLLDFYHECCNLIESESLPHGSTLFDIGSGPTLYQLISLSRIFSELFLFEYSPANRDILYRSLNSDSRFSWQRFIDYTAALEQKPGRQLQERLFSRVRAVLPVDLKQPPEQSGLLPGRIGALNSSFCAESITDSLPELNSLIEKLVSLLKAGGIWVSTMLTGAESYRVGSRSFAAVKIDRNFIEKMLVKNNMRMLLYRETEAAPDHDYSGLAAFLALKEDEQ